MDEIVSIIGVPWNSPKWTDHFISQVRDSTKYPYKIYISDNSDSSRDVGDKDVEYWWNGGNIGFAKAMNIALRRAQSDKVIIANIDIDLVVGWLGKLVEAYDSSDYAIISARSNDRPVRFHPPNRGLRELLAAPNCVLWITSKSRLFDKVGYYDETIEPIACSDLYFCWRVWKVGGRVGVLTDVTIFHHGSGVIESNVDREVYKGWVANAKKYLVEKYGPEFGGEKPK